MVDFWLRPCSRGQQGRWQCLGVVSTPHIRSKRGRLAAQLYVVGAPAPRTGRVACLVAATYHAGHCGRQCGRRSALSPTRSVTPMPGSAPSKALGPFPSPPAASTSRSPPRYLIADRWHRLRFHHCRLLRIAFPSSWGMGRRQSLGWATGTLFRLPIAIVVLTFGFFGCRYIWGSLIWPLQVSSSLAVWEESSSSFR
jgi:hypothetical protein